MIETTAPPTTTNTHPALRALATLATGLLGGLAFGVLARVWMRIISDEPEFTWDGTIFIVGAFTVFGFTQSIAAAARRSGRGGWLLAVARVVAVAGSLGIFVGAGAIMLPTVVLIGLAAARTTWHWLLRCIVAVLGLAPALIVATQIAGEFGFAMQTLVGVPLFLLIYGTVVWATRFAYAARPNPRPTRWGRVAAIVGFAAAALLVFMATVGP